MINMHFSSEYLEFNQVSLTTLCVMVIYLLLLDGSGNFAQVVVFQEALSGMFTPAVVTFNMV